MPYIGWNILFVSFSVESECPFSFSLTETEESAGLAPSLP